MGSAADLKAHSICLDGFFLICYYYLLVIKLKLVSLSVWLSLVKCFV